MNTILVKFIVKNALENLTYQINDFYDGYREINIDENDLNEFAENIVNSENIKSLQIGIVTPISREFELKRKEFMLKYPLSNFYWIRTEDDLLGRIFDKMMFVFKHEYMDPKFLEQCQSRVK